MAHYCYMIAIPICPFFERLSEALISKLFGNEKVKDQ